MSDLFSVLLYLREPYSIYYSHYQWLWLGFILLYDSKDNMDGIGQKHIFRLLCVAVQQARNLLRLPNLQGGGEGARMRQRSGSDEVNTTVCTGKMASLTSSSSILETIEKIFLMDHFMYS